MGVVKAVTAVGKAIIKQRREGGRPHSGAQGAARRPFLCSPLVAGVAVYAFLDGRSHMTSNTGRRMGTTKCRPNQNRELLNTASKGLSSFQETSFMEAPFGPSFIRLFSPSLPSDPSD